MAKELGPSARALASFEKDFAKSFGEGRLITPIEEGYRVVSTGSLTLDMAMGCGGYIVGKITELWGPESIGKTTFAMTGAGNFQRAIPERLVGWIDMERAWDARWAAQHGMNLRKTRVVKPDSSEQAADMAKKMVRSGLYSFIVLDSIGGMITEEEIDKDSDQASMGTGSKVITRMVHQQAVFCDNLQTTMLLINQVRANFNPRGADTKSAGPFALGHVSTHKIKGRRTGTAPYIIGSGENEETVGFEIAMTVERNRVAPPRRTATFALFNQDTDKYGPLGVDQASEALTMGVRLGVIDNSTQGYYLLPDTEKKINGKPKALAVLRSEPEMLERVRTLMLERIADQVHEEADEGSEDGPEELDFATGTPEGFEPDRELIARVQETAAV